MHSIREPGCLSKSAGLDSVLTALAFALHAALDDWFALTSLLNAS